MFKEFEVRWEGVLPAASEQVWEALTLRSAGWIWEISYEPRVGGAERGLSRNGGTVTVWEPPRELHTNAWRCDGWRNDLDYKLEPTADGTLLRYHQVGVLPADEYDEQYDACVQHTDFYYHSLGEYVRHFAGRDATYVELEAPGSFAAVRRLLGVSDGAQVGHAVRVQPAGAAVLDGTVDYLTPAFLGIRTDDALIRVFGRDAWGGPVGITLHLFAPDADASQVQRTWEEWLSSAFPA